MLTITAARRGLLLRPPIQALARMRDDLDEGMYRHNIARDE
jgi:hypothetical protein